MLHGWLVNAAVVSFYIDVIEDCVPHCIPTASEMEVDQATKAAICRLGYSIF